MAASWDTSLSCPVTALRHEEPGHDGTPGRCAGLAGAEGCLPWHIRAGGGRSWAGETALTPRAPPRKLHTCQILQRGQGSCSRRAHAQLFSSPFPALPGSEAQLPAAAARAAAQTWKCQISFSPRTQQGLFPQVCGRDSPAPALPSPGPVGAAVAPCWVLPGGCGVPSPGPVWGAVLGAAPARCAMNSSHVCQQPLGTAGRGMGMVSTCPARSSLPDFGRNDSARNPVSHLLFF